MKQPEPDPLVHAVARHLVDAQQQALPPEALSSSATLLLDCIGACIAGRHSDGCRELQALYTKTGGAEEASVVGSQLRLPVQAAAALNSAMSRACEIDDVSERAILHPSATIVPAALAAVETSGRIVTGTELLSAIVVATDLANRIAWAALIPRELEKRPRLMNPNVQIGVFTAAITAAFLWRFDYEEIVRTIGHAYGQLFGNQQSILDGVLAVRLHQGLATGAGVQAAQFAQAGITSTSRAFEGRAGYYNAFWEGNYDRDQILRGLGSDFTVGEVSIKPYPSCKYTHTAVAAAVDIGRQRPVTGIDDYEHVEVEIVSREYFELVCFPVGEKQDPKNSVEMQFSLPFQVALALLSGPPSLQTMAWPPSADALRLAKKVAPVLRAEPVDRIPSPATVRVRYTDGRQLEVTRQTAPGHPLTPMSPAEMEAKFLGLAMYTEPRIPQDKLDGCIDGLRNMRHLSDAGGWIRNVLVW